MPAPFSSATSRWRRVLTTQGGLSTQSSTEEFADIFRSAERHSLCRQLAVAHKTPKRGAAVKQPHRGLKPLERARRQRAINIVEWRRTIRPAILRKATTATIGVDWSPALFATLLEELGENDGLESLLGPIPNLELGAYPQAIALALILRHSWQPHRLRTILESLELVDRDSIGRSLRRANRRS